jgi:hypothetical protein
MAIETQPGAERIQPTGPGAGGAGRPWWMRPAFHTGLIGGVAGYLLGHWLGNFLASGYAQNPLSDSNDVPIVLGYALGTIGCTISSTRQPAAWPSTSGTPSTTRWWASSTCSG